MEITGLLKEVAEYMASGVGGRLLDLLREVQVTTTWTVVVTEEADTWSKYDISHDNQRDFAEEIERDIIEFLDNLRKGAVLHGNGGSKLRALVFPLNGSYVRVVQGRPDRRRLRPAGVTGDGRVRFLPSGSVPISQAAQPHLQRQTCASIPFRRTPMVTSRRQAR